MLEPRTDEEVVVPENILQPFSNIIDCLFHSKIPCCNHLGNDSYASLILERTSFAASPLFANIAIDVESIIRSGL